ncbi:PREDICTED: protein MON2 homolog isoform X2 [Nicrophorus vespilloides]|uniref:Protein MON2 homolog n=1 Tax=Nicrophorus vespilloides TaxID=110193 RepID=A0ABM1N7M4_NICVS|nr:PREDICTED: protein MON2 homolog isoform X2 [Nicrophorus vespilloides]
MSFESGSISSESSQAFIEILQNDFKNLSLETKKKYPQIKESCEEAIVKLRGSTSAPQTPIYYVINQIIYPLVQGCESKDMKIIRCCLQIMQRLITQQVVDSKGARYITDTLWMLMEAGIEEVKVLQSVTLLLTTNSVVHGDTLARTLVLCFRLHFAKNSTTINTAGATVRQLVSLVFERVVAEDEYLSKSENPPATRQVNLEELKVASGVPPKGLSACAADAFLLFQDLVQLVNADQPYWLQGMTEMTRTFGLELLESVLTQFSVVFFKNAEFSFLLKERVCALVIKLFSPNIKYRSTIPASVQQATPFDKPYFPISMRLLRVVSILIQKYHVLLVTECEIFLSLIVKFLDPDKPSWQRALALEVLHKMTIQPKLLNSFCEFYDLKKHTTSIFQDIVNSLGAYVQSLFVPAQLQAGTLPMAPGQAPQYLAGVQPVQGLSSQAGFLSRGIMLPIVVNFQTGQSKSLYLEMLDKIEPPMIPDGYGISIAYACLLEIIRSLQISIDKQIVDETDEKVDGKPDNKDNIELHCQLINSSWCGLLAALSPLMEASTDEGITENILKSMQTYGALCGYLNLQTPRDAFITAICKSSLPPHYALTVLNAVTPGAPLRAHNDINTQFLNQCAETDYRQQIVAVGTPLPTSTIPNGAQQGPVMLTAKNLHSMRALLNLAHCHGSILGSSWHLVLTTLQHLVWILGLKPSTGGSLKVGRIIDTNNVITTHVMSDLPVLSTMLSRLFESSQYLDDVALHHLINALCKLSQEAMELAYTNREPSLFAVAKLLETGIVNMNRIEVLWRPLTNHLLEVCHHPHMRMREWGVEAITYLVKAALLFKHEIPLRENQKLQTLLIGPLAELSSVPHGDVRQRQLECVLDILHVAGETLSHGWPLVLGIIGAVSDHHGENLIRIAFQCLQLVITDFLPVMPWRCLPLCVDTVTKFGSQMQELNISLTAVGLMWNISDYFHQNQAKLSQIFSEDVNVFPEFPGTLNVPNFDKLWMCLYGRLGDLCVDTRPAVRKSASQTLFSTISAHGSLLKHSTWQAVLWQVLFPLLDKVHMHSRSASSEKVDTGANILIHHTRNTAQKQWAETQVLTLSGVARVFNTKRQLLQALGDFPRAWSVLLNFIENSALAKNNEVSFAALKSFQEILYLNKNPSAENKGAAVEDKDIWAIAWRVWVKIGTEITLPLIENVPGEDAYLPSQSFLTALVQIFPSVFQHVKSGFEVSDLDNLCRVLTNAVSIPVYGESSQYMVSTTSEFNLTTLHDGSLQAVELVQKEAVARNQFNMLPGIFKQLLSFSKFSCYPPTSTKQEMRASPDWLTMNYIPFGEKALTSAVALYETTADNEEVIYSNVLRDIIASLHVPLSLKYGCPSSSTWKLAANSFINVLKVGLPVTRNLNNTTMNDMWDQLATTLNEFLFPKMCAPADRGLDEIVSDEATDCQLIEIMRSQVLPYSGSIPREFILKIVVLLNRGSIHSATNANMDSETELTLREEFAKTCFETLLQFSLVDEESQSSLFNGTDATDNGIAGKLAVTALLHRFQEVLKKYIDDEKQSGKCPLPRLSEISFVLKAITTVIISMKKATVNKDDAAWEQLISLYPYLVECTTTTSTQVSRPLREALLQFCDLLQPPNQNSKLSNGN